MERREAVPGRAPEVAVERRAGVGALPLPALAAGMQAVVGNHATAALLQREYKVWDSEGVSAGDRIKVREYAAALDKATDRAYWYVIHVPLLGAYSNLDGHTMHWCDHWQAHSQGKTMPLMAAAFGYVIESLATLVYLPPPPAGLTIELQGPRGGTRPDVILKRGTLDVGWLDLTSSDSAGHIWTKAKGWGAVSAAEIVYRPLDVHAFNPTPGYADTGGDPTEFLKRTFWAKRLIAARRITWRTLGAKLLAGMPRGADAILRAAARRTHARDRLQQYFGLKRIDDETLASVIYAMGRDAATHGFDVQVSRVRGESFLLAHDPKLLTFEIPEDGVPRPVAESRSLLQLLDLPVDILQHDPETLEAQTPGPSSLPISLSSPASSSLSSPASSSLSSPTSSSLALSSSSSSLSAPLASFVATFDGPLPTLSGSVVGRLGAWLTEHQFSLGLQLPSGSGFVIDPRTGFAGNFAYAWQSLAGDREEKTERRTELPASTSRSPRSKELTELRSQRVQIRINLIPFAERPRDAPVPQIAGVLGPLLLTRANQ